MKNSIKQRIFIVGCPRSGTTFLQTLLLQHPSIISYPESHFFVNIIKSRNPIKFHSSIKSNLKRWNSILNENNYKTYPIKFNFSLNSYINQFIKSLDSNTLENNKTIWIEKTPSHLYSIEHIQSCIPDVKFIHLFRNGEDVVASMYEVTNKYSEIWNKKYTVEEAVQRYNHDIEISKKYKGLKNHFFITYESLLDSLENVKTVYDFLELEYPKEIKLIPDNKIIREEEKWKANNHSDKVVNTRGKKFNKIFSKEEQSYIKSHIVRLDEFIESCTK